MHALKYYVSRNIPQTVQKMVQKRWEMVWTKPDQIGSNKRQVGHDHGSAGSKAIGLDEIAIEETWHGGTAAAARVGDGRVDDGEPRGCVSRSNSCRSWPELSSQMASRWRSKALVGRGERRQEARREASAINPS